MSSKVRIPGRGIIASCVGLFFVLAFALFIRGCMNEHSRHPGPGYVTFAISPKGDRLVFSAVGAGGSDLYVLDLETLTVRAITESPDYEVDPSFSPDGKSIVYAAGKPGDRADHLFVCSLEGNLVKQLTAEDANDSSPEFSPDGSQIVFSRARTYNWGGLAANWGGDEVVCVVNADGSGFRQVTKNVDFALNPHYSGDGQTILFTGSQGLYTIPADGSQPPTWLSAQEVHDAVYSPDGRSIALVMGQYASDQEIFLCRSDGLGVKPLTRIGKGQSSTEGAGCTRPVFTPDGKRIMFFLEIWPDGPTGYGKENLWEIAVDGTGLRKIADYGLFDDPLHWRPARPKDETVKEE